MKALFIALFLVSTAFALTSRNALFEASHLDAKAWNEKFENKEVVALKKEAFGKLPVSKGQTIADVGAGTGVFEKDLSALVGTKGKVFAVEVSESFIPFLKKRFAQEKLSNVEVVKGKRTTTTLPVNSTDLVLVIDTYHHFDSPDLMVKDFSKILKSKGHLVIIDFARGPKAPSWVNEHVYMTKEECIQVVTKNGFKFLRQENVPYKDSFQLTFQKDE